MPDGRRTLEDELEEIKDGSCEITFNEDGSITQEMTNSGMIITTEFGQADGVITETCTYADGTLYYTKTTTFNNDGTITISKVYADNSEPVVPEQQEGGGE
jgi:hypothetical protein